MFIYRLHVIYNKDGEAITLDTYFTEYTEAKVAKGYIDTDAALGRVTATIYKEAIDTPMTVYKAVLYMTKE